MPRLRDQAVCLRDQDWSESSQIVVLLTREHGILRGLAKGSRRQSPSLLQRFSGGIDLLTEGEIVAAWRDSHDLATLTEWDLQQTFGRLRRDLTAQHAAMYAAQITQLMFAEHDPHPQLFEAMLNLLSHIDQETAIDPPLLVYQWQLLCEAGLQPQLTQDVRSHGPLVEQGQYAFDPQAGGLTAAQGQTTWQVRSATVAMLREIASTLSAPPTCDLTTARRANRLLAAYLRYHTDRELATAQWMQRPVL